VLNSPHFKQKPNNRAKAAGLMLDAELISGDEVGTIIECTIKHHSDLLVLGMRKHTWLIGSTTRDLSERAPCALLGIK
jgi:nucleotide-binding universal stress UspA family protein